MIRFALLSVVLASLTVSPALGASGNAVCVKVSRANLRAGPANTYRITWEVNRFMPLVQVGKDGDWLKVRDVDGDIHWIYDRLVSNDIDCITISASKANIRKKPSTNSEKWFQVEKYTSFKRVGHKGKWVKIEYEGEVMWVFDSLVWPG
jgi:SH3-like domain-containing protein